MGDTKTIKGPEREEGAGARKDRRDNNLVDKQVPLEGDDKVDALYEAFFEEVQNSEGKLKFYDIHSEELTLDSEDQKRLHAISFYIRDGEIESWMLDWLEDNTQRLGDALSNPTIKRLVMEGWADNNKRTFKGEYGGEMTPLRALESYAIELSQTYQTEITTTADIDNDATLSDGEILLQGEAAQEALGLTETDLTPDLDL
jgi:hypothetical protein